MRGPSESRTAHRSIGALILAAVALMASACASPATFVMVLVDTDAPERVTSMRATVSRGASTSMHPERRGWQNNDAVRDLTFPASFSIVPGDGAHDGTVTLDVDLAFAGLPTSPAVTVRRTARFRFTPHQANYVRLFLPATCAALVAPPDACATDTTAPCTLSRFCAEQEGQTCGNDGACVSIDVTPQPLHDDAGDALDIALRVDAPIDAPADGNDAAMVPDVCVPACNARECGPDGCGATCGTCVAGSTCDSSGRCAVASCTPQCAARECGPDGCGSSCGTCPSGQTCQTGGTCACVPDCSGRTCGGDGCGGSCGTCSGTQTCSSAGRCVATCTRNCAGRTCGSDGCSGSCGTCAAGQSCNASGQCVCAPNCVGRSCGPNGCGGSCGTCAAGLACNAAGRCVCAPQCAGRACGGDACGGSCGTCATNFVCNTSGACIACIAGMACNTGNPCTTGRIGCGTGRPVCTASGNKTAGTACTGGVCDGAGHCVACMEGAACTLGNDCVATATIECSSGAPVCTARTFVASGAACSSFLDRSRCDGAGHCVCIPQSGRCNRCGICNFGCTGLCP